MMHSSPATPAPRNANAASVVSKNNTPAVVEEEPKKPALGDVRMAAPKIGRGKAAAAPGESEPSIDMNQVASLPAPVSALGSSHKAGPAAPAPVGGDVKPAKLLKSVPPVYPDMARNQRIAGNVQIDALIGTDGNVSTMKVLSGPPLLHQAAMNAVKQWKFQPAELNGNPTTMHLTVMVQFRTQ
jgi:protein TonB